MSESEYVKNNTHRIFSVVSYTLWRILFLPQWTQSTRSLRMA